MAEVMSQEQGTPKPFKEAAGGKPNQAPSDHGITSAIQCPGLTLGSRVTVDYKGRDVTDHQWTSRWHVRSSMANKEHPAFDRTYFDRPQPRPLYRHGPGASEGNEYAMSIAERLDAVRRGHNFSFTVPRIGSLSLIMNCSKPLPKRSKSKRRRDPLAPPANCQDLEWLKWWDNVKASHCCPPTSHCCPPTSHCSPPTSHC